MNLFKAVFGRYKYGLTAVCLMLFFSSLLRAQGPIGLPQVNMYSGPSYKGGTQNWGIDQDEKGIIYFANNEGLLTFNGANWKLYTIPNKTIVRSVFVDKGGRIYIGAQDEIGYFYPNEQGVLTYHSLKHLIPEKERNFADVWNIVKWEQGLYFRTINKIICIQDQKAMVYPSKGTWVYMGVVNGQLMAQDIGNGLQVFQNEQWNLWCNDSRILHSNITALLPYQSDSLLMTTLENGVFYLKGKRLIPKKTQLDPVFINDRINVGIAINDELYAMGSTSSALLIVNKKGELMQQFSYAEGMTNNHVRSILMDHHKNLWLGLDDGVAYIAFNSPIKSIYPDKNKQISSYATQIFKQRLYVGTSNGLFAAPLSTVAQDLSGIKSTFQKVSNTKGQTWGLSVIQDQLLLANENGAQQVVHETAKNLFSGNGIWSFISLGHDSLARYIVSGTYSGLHLFKMEGQEILNKGVFSSLEEPLRFVVVDPVLNCIWAAHPYRGIYKLDLSPDGKRIVKTNFLNQRHGLPSNLYNYVFFIKGKVIMPTAEGIYEYHSRDNRFIRSVFYDPIFKNIPIQYLKEDARGNIWFVSNKKVGVVDFNRKSRKDGYTLVELPELTNKIVAGFEHIYPYNEHNIFIGANKGLIHLDYKKYAENVQKPNVLLTQIKVLNKGDSIIFGGYARLGDQDRKIMRLKYDFNSLNFEFASTLFDQKDNIEYSYKLIGFDEDWSAWSAKSDKDYTNLPHGNFTFVVKARNNLGSESESVSYQFFINPVWYKTKIAYGIYILFLLIVFYLMIKYLEKEHKRERDHLRQQHQHEIERNEQQIVKLQKKQLEAEVEFKNKELASATMHLVQRGKLLSKIGDELAPLVKNHQGSGDDLKKVIRLINEAKKLDNDWEQFAVHFDHVHTNFLSNLKERYPNLSPSDLKLCAYLKLNLSSKEIAQLLNITPRAVEVSRYRLRKKLGLTPEINLFDFLFK